MSTSRLSTKASPTSLPPVTRPATAPGTSFFSKTPAMILVTAMEHSGVLGEGFQIVALPAAIEIARFLQKQARAGGGGGGRRSSSFDLFYATRGKECQIYQPYTATGKLNADRTPMTPRGFGTANGTR